LLAFKQDSSVAFSDEFEEKEFNQEKENKEEVHPYLLQFKNISDQVTSLREAFNGIIGNLDDLYNLLEKAIHKPI